MNEWIEIDLADEQAQVPEIYQKVLCYRKLKDSELYIVAEYHGFEDQREFPCHIFFVEDSEMGWIFGAEYWMPLPEPPSEC